MQVPLDEPKSQRSIILPDRLWKFAKQVDKSYAKGIRQVLEVSYEKYKEDKARERVKNQERLLKCQN
jgi:hypothetical protein